MDRRGRGVSRGRGERAASGRVTVVVVDHQPAVCGSLMALLSTDPTLHVVGWGSSPNDVIGLLELRPDVVVLSGDFTVHRGLDVVRNVRTASSKPAVVVLSEGSAGVPAEVAAEASDVVLAQAPVRELIDVVHRVARPE